MTKLTSEQILEIYNSELNPGSETYQFALKNGILLDYTGSEVFAIWGPQNGKSFFLLVHKILILIYLDKINEYSNLRDIVIQSFVTYVNDSIAGNSITLVDLSFDDSLSNEFWFILQRLEEYLKQIIAEDQTLDQVNLARRVEFCTYFLLVEATYSLLKGLGITSDDHYSLHALGAKDDKGIKSLISCCFSPTENIRYSPSITPLWSTKEKEFDKWLQSQIPKIIIRGVFSSEKNKKEIENFDLKGVVQILKRLIQNPKEIKKTLEGEDNTVITFIAFLGLLVIWKDGFAVFGFIPIFGDLFSTLGNTVYGRMLGVIVYGFLLIDYQFSFSIRKMTKGNNKIILIVLLLILFVSALLV